MAEFQKWVEAKMAETEKTVSTLVDGFKGHESTLNSILPTIRGIASRLEAEASKAGSETEAEAQSFVYWVRDEIAALHAKADKALRGGFG